MLRIGVVQTAAQGRVCLPPPGGGGRLPRAQYALIPRAPHDFSQAQALSGNLCDPTKRAGMAAVAQNCGVAAVEPLDAAGRASLGAAAAGAPADFADVPRKQTDLAAILYTSGTTGRSKGAMMTHRNLASNAATLAKVWRFTERDVLLHALPIYHTHGLFVATNVTMVAGGSMIFLPRFDPGEMLRLLPKATA